MCAHSSRLETAPAGGTADIVVEDSIVIEDHRGSPRPLGGEGLGERGSQSQYRVVAVAIFSLLCLTTSTSHAQRPQSFQFDPQTFRSKPNKFLQDMFGEESEADRQALQKIKISIRDERQFGANAVNAFRAQLKQQNVTVLERGQDVDYLRCLVNQIRPLMKNQRRYPKIKVLLVDTEDTDARSFPGGTIVIYRGLIDYCESEAALVGILGHEISHADRGHQLYYLRRFKQMQQSFRPGQFNPRSMMNMGSTMAKTFARPYRPEEETEADEDGATWAFQLGYDPDEMARVFLRLHQRDGDKAKPVPSFLRSHPYHEDRYAAILKRVEVLRRKSKKSVELYVGTENLSERICRKRRNSTNRTNARP